MPEMMLSREAASRPTSWNASERTIEATIATGTPVTRRDEQGEFLEVLDLSGADLAALRGANVLDGHSPGVSNIIGVVEDARVENGEIIARLRMSSRPELASVVRDIGEGIIRNISVGYSVAEWRNSRANGQRTRTAVKWTPREVSFVSVPADRNAHTRNANMNDRTTINRQIRELASRAGATATVIDDLIDRQATIEQARSAILDDVLARGSTSIRPTGRSMDDPMQFRDAVSDALCFRIDPNRKPKNQAANQYIGLTIPDIGRLCLHPRGHEHHRAACRCADNARAQQHERLSVADAGRDQQNIESGLRGRTERLEARRPRNIGRRLPHQAPHHARQHRLHA